MSVPDDLTAHLEASLGGSSDSHDELVRRVYDTLHAIAVRHLQAERSDHTLQPTALVHEAYLRLIDQQRVQWQSRQHFFATAAGLMRRALVDHARRQKAEKRGGGAARVPLESWDEAEDGAPLDLLSLDEALSALERFDPDKSRLVELRYFAGMTTAETAAVLETSVSSVERQWRVARAWLLDKLTGGTTDRGGTLGAS